MYVCVYLLKKTFNKVLNAQKAYKTVTGGLSPACISVPGAAPYRSWTPYPRIVLLGSTVNLPRATVVLTISINKTDPTSSSSEG